jgi:hypothetical protein
MAVKQKLIKSGDRTFVVDSYKGVSEIANRMPSAEAQFAMGLIDKWAMVATQGQNGGDSKPMKPEEAVERAFYIAYLTFKHIKEYRMDAPFPFEKVYGNAKEND